MTTGALPTLAAGDTAPPVLASTAAVKLEYWHKDHLGSTAATTDQTGQVTARYAYDPFGKRRATNGSYDAAGAIVVDWSPAVNNGNDRGFTGHEHLDDVGLVHMNGRVFDPRLGVFLQADPMTQDPFNMQGYNRYGYCYNNPLTCTDPSGLSSWTDFRDGFVKPAIAIAVAVMVPELIQGVMIALANGGVTAFVTMSGGTIFSSAAVAITPLGSFTSAAVAGFASGAIASGNIEGGLQGAFTAAMFYGAGDLIAGTGAFAGAGGVSNQFGQVAIHAVVGCVTSEVGGSKCGPGAASAAFSKFATVNGFVGKDVVSGTITSAVIGGTAAELGGGKFANGARTAAFGYLFNHCAHVEGGCWAALKDAASMTYDWASGSGASTRVFGPGSIQVIDMMDAPGVNGARDLYYQKNAAALANGDYGALQPVTNYSAKFGVLDYLTTSSPTQQFVGSYRVDVYPVNGGRDVMFVLNNNSSLRSFLYGIGPAYERSMLAPAGNMRQTYWWTESKRP